MSQDYSLLMLMGGTKFTETLSTNKHFRVWLSVLLLDWEDLTEPVRNMCRSYFTPKEKRREIVFDCHASKAVLPCYITIMHFGNVNNSDQQTPNHNLKPV